MKYFTYKDYIESIHKLRLNAIDLLKEEEEKYCIKGTSKAEVVYTKQIEKLLEDKEEVCKFLNIYLKAENKIIKDNLERERYNDKFAFKDDSNEYVYKLKNRDIYFILKSCYIFDNKLIYTIINKCVSTMRRYAKRNKENLDIKFPVIVPIIIYHGDNIEILKNNNVKFVKDNRIEIENIKLKYNMINGFEKELYTSENLKSSRLLKLIKIRRSAKYFEFLENLDE